MGIPKPVEPRPFAVIMTDEEFQEYHNKKRKEELLSEMMSAANKSFSVKNVKREKESAPKPILSANGPILELVPDPSAKKKDMSIEDTDWDAILEKASEFTPSPIDDITAHEMGTFRLEDADIPDPDRYDGMFKKEQAMLAEILQDVTDQAKAANAKLKDMTKKSAGYGGVSKTYPDLLSAANSLNSTRLSIVKEMAGLKKTVADLNFKKEKELGGMAGGASNDDIADNFYKNIIGNRKAFIDSAMGGMMPTTVTRPHPDPIEDYQPKMRNTPAGTDSVDYYDDEPPVRNSYSITSPLGYNNGDYVDDSETDPYGYIRNEDRNVEICVQKYQDGRIEFVAVDQDGEGVDGYELPADDLLGTLQFRPGSRFASDTEGRRYRIIEIEPGGGIDISDVFDDD